MAALEQLVQRLQRDVSCLQDENRSTRRRALERLRKEAVPSFPPHHEDMMDGLLNFLLKPLLKELSDPVEKCRELAIGIIAELCASMQHQVTDFLPLLLPVLVSRLGSEEVTEPSEELRLQLLCLLSSLVQACACGMAPYLDDMILILQRTIVDPYPELKKESCHCVLHVATAVPVVFYQQSSSLVKPLLRCMTHQHSKVRMAAIKALGCAVRKGSATAIDDALSPLAQRVSDSTPSVRSCLVDMLADWLLHQPDRYSYHHKLIPLLLICMSDEVPDISNKAHILWEKIGAQFENENEDDLKDQMDFMQIVETMPGLPFDRPRLGCRVLIYRCFSKILPALLKDIADWTVNSRIKASQLLFILLYHLEEHATHHIHAIINALYKACQDEDSTVVKQAVRCGEVLGYYVSVEVWSSLVVPAVKTSAGCHMVNAQQRSTVPVGPVQCTSCLMVLAACMRGAKKDCIQPYLKVLSDCVSEPEVGQSESLPLLEQLLQCVTAITSAAVRTCRMHSAALFCVLLRIAASRHALTLGSQVDNALELLAVTQDMTSVMNLYEAHAGSIMQTIKLNYRGWTINTPDCALFSSLLSGAGPVIGQVLDDVIPVLTQCLHPDGDPEMRLHFITLLIRLLLGAQTTVNSQHQFHNFAGRVLCDILIPNCVWKGGRTAAAIRTASMTCVQALLQGKLLSADQLSLSLEDLLPKVVSCLDDTNQSTRLVSCKVLQLLFTEKQLWNSDKLHQLYSDLLKRMDDNCDEIRVAVARTLVSYVSVFPDDYSKDLYKAHTEELYKGLLIHLDDPSSEIQVEVLCVLKEASRLNPDLLQTQIKDVKHKHREDRYCEELLDFIRQKN